MVNKGINFGVLLASAVTNNNIYFKIARKKDIEYSHHKVMINV
jgi:hypothetical protein